MYLTSQHATYSWCIDIQDQETIEDSERVLLFQCTRVLALLAFVVFLFLKSATYQVQVAKS